MSIFKDITQTVKSIFSADDDMIFDDENDFEVNREPQNPFLKKSNVNKIPKATKVEPVAPSFDLGNHGFNMSRTNQANKRERSNGKIQIYVPKTFEEAFTIIKDVKAGFTAMVNVEVANPQISQRLIDVVSGAIYALDGECKKMGEKQYIFSLSAETIGAYDYLPINGDSSMQTQGSGFNFNLGQMYDFNQGQGSTQAPQGFNIPFNQNMTQNSFANGGFTPSGNAFNQNVEKLSQDLQGFYVPPKSQF